jgi:hypothetical protein
VETDIAEISKRVNELAGIKESDTGLAPPALWDLAADKQSMQSEQPLQVLHNISFLPAVFCISIRWIRKLIGLLIPDPDYLSKIEEI